MIMFVCICFVVLYIVCICWVDFFNEGVVVVLIVFFVVKFRCGMRILVFVCVSFIVCDLLK